MGFADQFPKFTGLRPFATAQTFHNPVNDGVDPIRRVTF